jgi:hypothetical protein
MRGRLQRQASSRPTVRPIWLGHLTRGIAFFEVGCDFSVSKMLPAFGFTQPFPNLVSGCALKTTLAQAGPVWRSRSSESLRRS